jgi:transposase-like protein
VDETAISIRGGSRYLYRAADKFGKTVDSLLCADRSVSAARAFFCKALKTHHPRQPQKLNLDGYAASHLALRLLVQENPDLQSVVIRSSRYLNNIVEQDHRAIKRRCAPMLALKSFRTRQSPLPVWNSRTESGKASSHCVPVARRLVTRLRQRRRRLAQ